MKILTITDSPTINSGLARVHRNVINGFLDAGHEVFPCVWFGYSPEDLQKIQKGEKPESIYYEHNGKKIRMFCLPKGRQNNVMFAACDAISGLAPDVVFTIGDYWDFFYMKALKEKLDYSFKWVFYPSIEENKIDQKWDGLFRSCDAVITPSAFASEALASFNVKSRVIPYGVGPEFFRYKPEDILELRKKQGSENKVRFVTVAQNTYRKNLPALLLALNNIKIRDKKTYERISIYIHTNIMRDHNEKYVYDLIELAEQLDVCDAISFPMVDCSVLSKKPMTDKDLADIYNASDYMVVPSSCEGYCLPMVEAMACGLPIVGANNTAIAEHIKTSQAGFKVATKREVFPPDKIVNAVDIDSLSDLLFDLVNGKFEALRKTMSEKAEKYAKSKTWEGMQASILEVVNEVPKALTIPVEVL